MSYELNDRKIDYLCPQCGGDAIWHDARAVWNVEKQEWQLSDLDAMLFCVDCDGEIKQARMIDVETGERLDLLARGA